MHRIQLRHLSWLIVLALAVPPGALAAGTIEGKVVFNGRPKRNPLIQMGADPNCLTINAGKKVVQKYVDLHRDGTIGNVFVHIVGDVAGGALPAEPVVIDQQGCIYHPRIAGAMVGQTLKIRNQDTTLHNVHSQSETTNNFNVGQPKAGMEFDYQLRKSEVMLRLKCDVHEWMIGFLGVKTHPYFAVSGEDGGFRIEGVPAGSYTLQAWQEQLGAVDQTIEVKDGETTTLEFAYGGPPKTSSLPPLEIQELAVPTVSR